MEKEPPIYPADVDPTSLQSIILYGFGGVLQDLPNHCVNGIWPLPNMVSLQFFHAALALYSTGPMPALPAHKVFAALRRADFPAFELVENEGSAQFPDPAREILASLSSDQAADMMANLLIACSEVTGLDRISVSTSHISSKRAFDLYVRLVRSSIKAETLESLSILGQSGSSVASNLSSVALEAVAEAVSGGNLTSLALVGIEKLDDNLLCFFLGRVGAGLERLNLAMTSICDLDALLADAFGFRTRLRVLDLSCTRVGADLDGLLSLLGLECIEELSLAWTPAVRPSSEDSSALDEAASVLGSVVADSNMPRLSFLDLSGSTVPLHHVLSGVTGLRRLVLSSCRIDDPNGDRLFADALPPNLQDLNISSCHGSAGMGYLLRGVARRVGNALECLSLSRSEFGGWDTGPGISFGNDNPTDDIAADLDVVFDDLRLALGPGLSGIRELDMSCIGMLTSSTLCAVLTAPGLAERLEILRMREVVAPRLAECLSSFCEVVGFAGVFRSLKFLDISQSELSYSSEAVLGSTGANLGWLVGQILAGSKCSTFKASSTKHMTYGVVTLVLETLRPTLCELDISFLPFPQQHVLTGGHYAVMPPISETFPNLRVLRAYGCGHLPRALIELLRKQAPTLEFVLPADEPGSLEKGAALGLAARKQAFGRELVRRANETQHQELSRLPWRVRP